MRRAVGLALSGVVAALLQLGAGPALAHGPDAHAGHGHHQALAAPQQQAWGIAAEARAAKLTITLRMTDDMRFAPGHFSVRLGEMVRLRVENHGWLIHEIVLGTPQTLAEHAELMRRHPGMEHDEPHMAHVSAGKAGELVWRFNRAGSFAFACLIPGHFQAGMQGSFTVVP
jgi:uncharacterized cupredoxin-like copper-binding protein